MKRILLLLVFCGGMTASSKAQEVYTMEELTAFSEVFFTLKKKKSDLLKDRSIAKSKVNKLDKSYYDLINQQITNEPYEVSKDHRALIRRVDQENDTIKKIESTLLSEELKKYHFTLTQYKSMLASYRSDLVFQRKLKPYFQKAIKNRLAND